MRVLTSLFLFVLIGVFALLLQPTTVNAHQPYCEFADTTPENAWQVPDSEVSYAYFGNIYPATDVDYFTFDATAGQSVLLSMSMPAIEGQEDYEPVMLLMGPGIDGIADNVPDRVVIPDGFGAMFIDVGDEAEYWYEPFGGQYYWNWDNYFFEAPIEASYTVAMWHPDETIGRYSFVVGEREEFGGDRECMGTFGEFWTPLIEGENPYRDMPMDMEMGDMTHQHADGMMHDHSTPMNIAASEAPVVDLQLVPLGDGSYNVRIQTLNFVFAPWNVDGEAIDGQGHAHLYVDGEKIARVYGEWYHLDPLSPDVEMVSVALYANNHQPLAVDGEPIADMVMIADLILANE